MSALRRVCCWFCGGARLVPDADKYPPRNGRLAATIGGSAALALTVLVGQFEGKRNDPYQDIVGVWTVCYGETNVSMRRYTDAECKDMLSDHLADYARPVLKRNPELSGHDNQIVAATSLSYNIGNGNYAKSKVAREFSAGRWRNACDAFLSWSYAGGKRVAGLLKRREQERAICLKGLP